MYDNDYSGISLWGVGAWMVVAASISFAINRLNDSSVREILLRLWTFFPAIAINGIFFALHFVLPDERYMSLPGWHWLVLLSAAIVLSLILMPPWAAVVWCSSKLANWYRGRLRADPAANGDKFHLKQRRQFVHAT